MFHSNLAPLSNRGINPLLQFIMPFHSLFLIGAIGAIGRGGGQECPPSVINPCSSVPSVVSFPSFPAMEWFGPILGSAQKALNS